MVEAASARKRGALVSSCRMEFCSEEGAEGKIRQQFIEENLLDTVVGLPENLFFGTGIPAAILIFDRSRETGGANSQRKDILFIDASREFQPGKNQNTLQRTRHRKDRLATYHERQEIEQYSRRVPVEEVQENEFNLNVPRYIDTFEAPAAVDIAALQQEIDGLEAELKLLFEQNCLRICANWNLSHKQIEVTHCDLKQAPLVEIGGQKEKAMPRSRASKPPPIVYHVTPKNAIPIEVIPDEQKQRSRQL